METAATNVVSASLICMETMADDGLAVPSDGQQCGRLSNSEFLSSEDLHVLYLHESQQVDVLNLFHSFPTLFGDVLLRTSGFQRDIDVGNAAQVKQHAYCCHVEKREKIKKEVNYLLENGLAKPNLSPWSSPCLLALKSDGTHRFCKDFREVKSVTVLDSFPHPRMDECIDSIGSAVFITKLDLLKGYWQASKIKVQIISIPRNISKKS